MEDFRGRDDITYTEEDENSLNTALYHYTDLKFPGLIRAFKAEEKERFINTLVLPLFAHRKGKGLAYL